jgi:hypothetical protein
MAKLKVFISSTCYDLGIVRSQLRNFVGNMGHEPVMSDYADILYDPRIHTHESCIQEVNNADVLILIIGSRFGGKSIPRALELVDFEEINKMSSALETIKDTKRISITQLEVFKAMQQGIPIFTFIDDKVLNDHLIYEKNKDKPFLNDIEFPAFQYNREAAKYVFEFINFMRLRFENNSICGFSKIENIEEFLKKQWSGLFQRLLYEYRFNKYEGRKIELLSEQIADIKTAIMTSISNADLKDTARGAIKFRRLIQGISYLSAISGTDIFLKNISWIKLLEEIGVEEIIKNNNTESYINSSFIIRNNKNRYFESRMPLRVFEDFQFQWDEFKDMSPESKKAIIAAINDNDLRMSPPFRDITYKYIEKESDILMEVSLDEIECKQV